MMTEAKDSIAIAISWCLAWGDRRQPLEVLHEMREVFDRRQTFPDTPFPEKVRSLVEQVQKLQTISFPENLTDLQHNKYQDIWDQKTRIGLVYGGATKIKGYVFESAKLPEIRGASALLDKINLVDLTAFFGKPHKDPAISKWLRENFPELEAALIPELIIYSTGGNILAFCPAAFINDLANAIEKRYTHETLTANSCAVGETFRLLELRFGLLEEPLENTKWLDWYLRGKDKHLNKYNPLVVAYFGRPEPGETWEDLFKNRKSFNELAGRLAALFNKRRNGNDLGNGRPSRCYPPMFETHPYLISDGSDVRSAMMKGEGLPNNPWFSEALARKRLMGEITKRKREVPREELPQWYEKANLDWKPEPPNKIESWVNKFEVFLKDEENIDYFESYYQGVEPREVSEARSLTEIGKASNGFVAYIYADGNNMGGYIQKIKTPQEYTQFSEEVFRVTENSVYRALKHLKVHKLEGLTGEHEDRNGEIIHPFEILTIGGDDVMLIVPADKGLEVARTIGEEFEKQLQLSKAYQLPEEKQDSSSVMCHRYRPENAEVSKCLLSMSVGVLIASYNTPIYYAENLTEQLLKSAKKRAKALKNDYNYYGGTVDFMVMKSVTAISSSISKFREEGLTKSLKPNQTLKLYAAPYTLYELGGLMGTAKALKESGLGRSQLYQIRSILEQGKHTAILNYRYFRVRLGKTEQDLLQKMFEKAWCEAKTNDGNLAPWMFDISQIYRNLKLAIVAEMIPAELLHMQYAVLKLLKSTKETIYETIWREIVDLYPFVETEEETSSSQPTMEVNR